MIIQGLLLIDPAAPPMPGWVRIEAGRIAEVGDGAFPGRGRGGPPGPPGTPGTPGPSDLAFAPGRIITPGFIDAHTHLPQVESVGCDGLPLLQWLDRIIFPAEMWWGRGAAPRMAAIAVSRMLRSGTLGFAGYLTSHGAVNAEVVRALAAGLGFTARPRCAVGRVAMDRHAPEDLLAEDRWRAAQSPIPSPILPSPGEPAPARIEISANPRFAIACSDELLAEVSWACAERARNGAAPLIQTHLSESPDELRRIAELFPSDAHYTAVYDRAGLLTPRTLLAHCVHLTDPEWSLIRARKSVVVHCPTANTFLGAGLFNLDQAREHGVRLALGSDVAAGPDVAMPRVARAMIEIAKVRRMTTAPGARIPTPAEAWRLITEGNADALGWSDSGRIEPGASADLLTLRVPETWLDEHLIGRLIYNWSSSLIEAAIVEGRMLPPHRI